METYKRQVAVKTTIAELLSGEFVRRDDMQPSFVRSQRGPISRVHLKAAVIDAEDPQAMLIDDGTGTMIVRSFDSALDVQVGDPVLVIGRIREFNKERYVIPEIVKKTDPAWLEYHHLEVKVSPARMPEPPEPPKAPDEQPVVSSGIDNLIETIQRLDTGGGADTQAVVDAAGADSEKMISALIENGDVFEIRPGRIKVL